MQMQSPYTSNVTTCTCEMEALYYIRHASIISSITPTRLCIVTPHYRQQKWQTEVQVRKHLCYYRQTTHKYV